MWFQAGLSIRVTCVVHRLAVLIKWCSGCSLNLARCLSYECFTHMGFPSSQEALLEHLDAGNDKASHLRVRGGRLSQLL